ncbi:MAG: glycosyltransferase family 2 protein [Armatimonadota bacterium]
MSNNAKYSVVIPVFNEEESIDKTYDRLKKVMDSVNEPYELIFVNDGSKDKSAELIKKLCSVDNNVKLMDFSRNFGHQVAITAGMAESTGDAVVVIDADLQDPPEVIPEMIEKWKEGYEVVYGKRTRRKGESFFKRITASLFYRIIKKLTTVDIPIEVGDFRLIDRKVCQALISIGERGRYVRGLVSWVGFRQTFVEYVRDKRFAGCTKYPLGKMIHLALDGITAFSTKPLEIATYIGFFLSSASFIYLLVVIYEKFFTKNTVAGWSSIMAISLFFNGVVLIILGIIGEYIGRIYEESKGRPLYIVREKVGFKD